MKVVSNSSRSAPGPDGIPYLAWKRLGDLGIDVLFDVAQALGIEDLDDHLRQIDPQGGGNSHTFNLGAIFLTKKAFGSDPLLGDCYSPNDVRPS